MREGRWTTVTGSEFDHERRGLKAIREKLPDADPWRAWSNFTFTANSGHVRSHGQVGRSSGPFPVRARPGRWGMAPRLTRSHSCRRGGRSVSSSPVPRP